MSRIRATGIGLLALYATTFITYSLLMRSPDPDSAGQVTLLLQEASRGNRSAFPAAPAPGLRPAEPVTLAADPSPAMWRMLPDFVEMKTARSRRMLEFWAVLTQPFPRRARWAWHDL